MIEWLQNSHHTTVTVKSCTQISRQRAFWPQDS